MRQALADLGAHEISPLAMAGIFLLIAIAALWVPIRLSTPDAAWVTARVVEKYGRYAEGVTLKNLRYAFVVNDNEFTGSSLVHDATYARTNVGDPLPVRYASSDPTVNRYVADLFVTGGEGGIAAFCLLMTALVPVASWRRRSLRAALPGGYALRK